MSKAYETIEYPATGAEYSHDEYGVYRYSEYPRGSVLEGQERRQSLGVYPTLAEAQATHPDARWEGDGASGYRDTPIPRTAPEWFREDDIGETWDDTDY
jgi:hypothetical protein